MRRMSLLAALVLAALPARAVPAPAEETTVALVVLRPDGPGRRAPVANARVSVWTEDTDPTGGDSNSNSLTPVSAFQRSAK